MYNFIREIFAVPFGLALNFFYTCTGSYVLSIVLLTFVIKLLLVPVSIKQQKSSAKQVRLNTKVNKIKQKYAGNQQKINEETQALYQREGFSAANMGCMPLAIQMVVMIGLYGIIYTPLSSVLRFADATIEKIKGVMPAVIEAASTAASKGSKGANQNMIEILLLRNVDSYKEQLSGVLTGDQINEMLALKSKFNFFGIDLTATPKFKEPSILWIIPVLAFVTAMASSVFMYIKQKQQNPEMAKNPSMGCMTFMSPFMSLAFTFMFPAGVGLYWAISNVFAFVQQIILTAVYSPKKVIAHQMVDETVERRSRENNVKHRAELDRKV